jgi:hypothetical protein
LRNQPGYEHLLEPLHILIEVEMEESKAEQSLKKGKEAIERLLNPTVSYHVISST